MAEDNQSSESISSCHLAEISMCDGETQTDRAVFCSQGIQVGEFPNRPYQSYETRKKSEIRSREICRLLLQR